MSNQFNALTPKEESIIVKKGTELPLLGEYYRNKRPGVYLCKRCGAELYHSEDKFDSSCGWPSFDDELPGAVKRQKDADGSRTEIICANCGAHLGHVFTGEKLTPKDTRHCVNSLSMKFISADFEREEENYAVFGGGCFWCFDSFFSQIKGIKEVTAGYAGGQSLNPTYHNLDDHAEVTKIIFDPEVVDFEQLLKVFFTSHNPTTLNCQGHDVGRQYRSIILYATLKQKTQAEVIIKQLNKEKIFKAPIVTEIKPLMNFYPAEDYHQDYYQKNPSAGYCQLVINPKLAKFRKTFQSLLKVTE